MKPGAAFTGEKSSLALVGAGAVGLSTIAVKSLSREASFLVLQDRMVKNIIADCGRFLSTGNDGPLASTVGAGATCALRLG